MKRSILAASIGIGLFTIMTACNSDNGEVENIQKESKDIQVHLDFADFGDDEEVEGTRSIQTEESVQKQIVNLGNRLYAEVAVQRDTVKAAKPATRSMVNGKYTIVAYQGNTIKDEIKGTVTGNKFTPETGTRDKLNLPHGTYTLVCFNDKVALSSGKYVISRANAADAFIGVRKNFVVNTNTPLKVSFTMNHVGARVRVRLFAFQRNLPGVTSVFSDAGGDTPTAVEYNPLTDDYNTINGSFTTGTSTYPSTFYTPAWSFTSPDYQYFLPNTDGSKLKITFKSGTVYNHPMTGASLVLKPSPTLKMAENGSYLITVRLMYNFLYLFSDGTRGFFNETTYGGAPVATAKTPVGIVISQNKRLAVALKDAASLTTWALSSFTGDTQFNKTVYPSINAALVAENGESETWEANASADNTTVKGLENAKFPAFWAAAHYNPGEPLTGGLVGKRWYLPAYGEFKYFFKELGLDNRSITVAQQYNNWNGELATEAFRQVGGYLPSGCQTSTELKVPYNPFFNVGVVGASTYGMTWAWEYHSSTHYVRSFIHY